MPKGQLTELNVERTILKAHRLEVLRALSDSPGGLAHHTLQYDVVKGSSASGILRELVALKLVEWRDARYLITARGKNTLSAVDRLRSIFASN